MRTKALLGLAVLAAGVCTTMAQNVYSLNVVGYHNIPIAANAKVMIANQLNTTNNTLASLIPSPPPLSAFYKYNGGFTGYIFDDIDLVWTPDGNATLNPGEGGFFQPPSATTLTFVGEVLQGNLTNTLPINTKVMRSSMVPQAGLITTDLKLPAEPLDAMYTFNGGYTGYIFDDIDLVWTPSQPNISVGQSFFYQKASGNTASLWIRNFTVGP